MHNGWIKLHRKLFDSPIYSNADMLKLWIHCLMKASHKEREQLVGNQMVELEAGDFVTGRNALADEFNKGAKKANVISPITLWRWLNNFEKWGMLNIKTTTKYSVVTVIGWAEYQQDEQQVNIKRTTSEQQVNTNKNVENDDNGKKKTVSPKRVYDEDSDFYILARFFYNEIKRNDEKMKEPNLQNWSNDIRLMIEIDGRDKREVSKIMRWVQQDGFEKSNVLSPSKLRKRYTALKIKYGETNGGQVPNTPTYAPINVNMNDGEG